MKELVERPARIPLLDALRGLSIILMIAYHAGVDLVMENLIPYGVLYNPLLGFLNPLFAGVFIVLAGISSRFSRSNLRRGLIALGCAVLVTAASLVILPAPFPSLRAALGFPVDNAEIGALVLENRLSLSDNAAKAVAALGADATESQVGGAAMRFYGSASDLLGFPILIGILHFMAACMLLYWVLDKLSRLMRLDGEDLSLVLGVPLLAAFLWVYSGLGFWPDIPSSDYYPIMPWCLLFFLGVYLGGPIKARKWPEWFYRFNVPFFPAIGRRTLIVYMAHQPIVYGIVLLIKLI
ncbi:MAG: DUF1624 domain-containing protein [Oscillospiraceae bacterium]|jgi:uncharacterized membrane protein|nr:DUF1624 domain-containing protein [Oscillospiraceae bacterium]